MLLNTPLFRAVKNLFIPTSIQKPDEVPKFYDLYNDQDQKPWNVVINPIDKLRVDHALSTNKPIRISSNLSDAELLKLHSLHATDFSTQLVYHEIFDMYEIKSERRTVTLFSYQSGIYTPISEIY